MEDPAAVKVEPVEGAECPVDCGGESALGGGSGLRSRELQEIQIVVQRLPGVVEHGCEPFGGSLHYERLERQIRHRGALDGLVEVRNVGS